MTMPMESNAIIARWRWRPRGIRLGASCEQNSEHLVHACQYEIAPDRVRHRADFGIAMTSSRSGRISIVSIASIAADEPDEKGPFLRQALARRC